MRDISDFGTFFHSIRVSRGLALMDFCRENNFNVVLVSNIERGMALPQKEEISVYLKALKIKKGSKSYLRFLELHEKSKKIRSEKIPHYSAIPEDKLEQIMKILSQ